MDFKKEIDEIKYILSNGLYVSALKLALTLPDTCGIAEYGYIGVGQRYRAWLNTYLADDNILIEVIYQLRNKTIHEHRLINTHDMVKIKIDKFTYRVTKVNKGFFGLYSFYNDGTSYICCIDINGIVNLLCDIAYKYFINNESKFTFLSLDNIDEYELDSSKEHKFEILNEAIKILNKD